jgi:23S rRNA pseudouridine2605 synthase
MRKPTRKSGSSAGGRSKAPYGGSKNTGDKKYSPKGSSSKGISRNPKPPSLSPSAPAANPLASKSYSKGLPAKPLSAKGFPARKALSAKSPASKSLASKSRPAKPDSPRFESPPVKATGKRFGKTSKPKPKTQQEILSEALSPKPKPKFKAGPPAKKALAPKRQADGETCRLNKWIADSGLCSRREADSLIEAGEVTVNGKRVNQLGTQMNPAVDQVKVRGQLVVMPRRPQTILFHKPKGVLTTRKDEQGRKTIYDCLSKDFQKLDPAGRLDRESTGALLLSSDGDLIFRLTHPKYHVLKVYRVKVDSPFTSKMLDKLTEGVFFEEEEKMAKADALDWEAPDTLKMTLSTGYNRQIRRMMEAIGKEVVSLKRLSVGPISLGHLAPGAARVLLPHELRALYQAVKLKP